MGAAAESFSGIADLLPGCSGRLSEPYVGEGGAVAHSSVSVGCVEIFVAGYDCSICEDSWKAKSVGTDVIGTF